MATPCTHDPNEVIEKVISAKENADKFDAFVNGTDTETVQLGAGDPTPSIRNAVRQVMADASWAKQYIADAPEGNISLNNAAAMNTYINRTLAERFADVINVKDYGAVGNGSADDRSAIQAALAAANNDAAPRLVVFPAGTYLVSDTLEIGANTTLRGLGEAIIRKNTGAVSKGLMVNSLGLAENGSLSGYNGNSNISIEHLIFEGEFYEETTSGHAEYGLSFAHCKNIAVRNCEFRYWNHCHLTEFSGVKNGLVENCHYHHIKYDTAYVQSGTYHINEIIQLDACNDTSTPIPDISSGDGTPNVNISVVNTVIGDADSDICGIGIGTYSLRDANYVDGLTVENCKISGAVRGLSMLNCKNVSVKGNNIEASLVGILVYAQGTASRFNNYVIEGNTVESDSYTINYNASSSANDRRINHTCINNVFVGGDNNISYIQDVHNLVFSSNQVAKNVVKFNGVTNASISGNVFAFCRYDSDSTGAAVTVGQSVNNNPSNVLLSGNKISNVYTTRGIRCVHVEQANLIGNTIWNLDLGNDGDSTCPLTFTNSTSAFTAGNTASGTGDFSYLIYCDSTSVATDGGNWCQTGVASNLNAIDNGKLVQLNGIQFANMTSKNTHFDIVYPVDMTNEYGGLSIATKDENGTIKRVAFFNRFGALLPSVDNELSSGWGNNRWTEVYAASGTINTSDMREKTNLAAPSEALMRAWGKVGFKVFQFIEAVQKKGADEARIHVGVIAQDVQAAFAEEGLDASRYGLFCYDSWKDEFEEVEVEDSPEVLNDEGVVVAQAQTHIERRQTKAAGNRYGIRYEEALALECAYQRWLGEKRDAKIAELVTRLNENSGNGPAHSGASPDNL